MRSKTRKWSLLMLFVVATCMMFGCGKKTNDDNNQVTSEKEEATTNTEAVTETTNNSEAIASESDTSKEEVKVEHIAGQTTLTYIGHAAVKIVSADGKVIYIDPAQRGGDYTDEADILLITHGHDDHKPQEDVKVKSDGTTITWKEAHPDESYATFDIGDIHIEAVPAANSNHKLEECVGYIITVDGVKIYHAGDTSTLDTMGELTSYEIDYAMYPIDGTYNMGPTEATEVANLIAAKNNIPIHEYDNVMGKKKSDKFLPEGRLVLEYGETIVVKDQSQ